MKKIIGIFAMLMVVALMTTSCNKDDEMLLGDGPEGTELNSGEGSEGTGGEGSESGGENHGNEGGEGSGGEGGNESGTLWGRTATADEIVNGIRLILTYNEATQSFEGTLENQNTTIAPQVRVEVHVFDAAGNSTEYGPTAPADMVPGEVRNVVLPTPGAGNFVNFNMHPEVG